MASQTNARDIIITPYELKLGETWESANVNRARPEHIASAARKSKGPA